MFADSDLLRLVEGDCSPDEAAAMQAWIAADPARVELLGQLRAVWRLTGGTTRRWDLTEARERLRLARAPGPRTLTLIPARPPGRPWLTRVAAAIALVTAGAVTGRLIRPAAPLREFATGPGQRLTLSLPDGSKIQLSVASRLRVLPGFGSRRRTVELEGEAFFDVRHDARRAFLVRTSRGTIEDLGTAFGVRATAPDRDVQVVVAAGSVTLRGAGPSAPAVTLRQRDRGVIDARGRVTVARGVALDRYLGWTRGALVFENAPLPAVLAQLDSWYDLDIRFADPSLARAHLTMSFATPSADDALAALARVLDVRVARTGKLVRFTSVHSRP